jgi:pimeloyl-ACP methyl ester carboxylesterase
MRRALALAAAFLAASAPGAVARELAYRPSALLPLDGTYRFADGNSLSLAVTPDGGLLYTDLHTGDLRQLDPAGASRFRFGPAYLVQRPLRGTIALRGDALTLTTGGRARIARRILVRRQRVVFRGAGDVRLVGKVTVPTAPGRHPGLAIVHGSDAMGRDSTDLFVNFFTSRGYAVLSYDKRGVGDSSGVYVERATESNIDNLAKDAVAALGVLAHRPDVDPGRLGLQGGSQAGWIIPRAAALSPLVHFAVVISGPAMSVGEQDAYASLTGQGGIEPPPTDAAIRKELTGVEPSGFDPRADLDRLDIPTLWLFGREDKTVYVPQSVEILQALDPGPTIRIFPGAGHFLLDTPHGLTSETPRAHRFAPGVFDTIAGWLAKLAPS